jgi:hypothetical protein
MDDPHAMSGSASNHAYERDYSGSGFEYDDRGVMTPTGEITTNENFRVFIRVRPPVPRELEGKKFINIVRVPQDHNSITICDVDTEDGRGSVYATQSYSFDFVFDQDARQREVYERSAHHAVQSVLQGYNATVMAYGQTGTGKTYTMEGFTNGEHRGIIPMATESIFAYIQANQRPNVTFKVRASYLQIYNEVVSDLLKPPGTKQLLIRQSKGRVSVDNLSEWVVKSPGDIYGLMERGCSVRATSATRMSELSSRSHAIFQIVVEIFEGEEGGRTYKVGKLNIVDLAGSEKVRSTGVTGQRLEEAKKINWSLHQLGNVISALADPNRRDPHIPYRNSKLTHLLTDSLGGNCKTTLIACISPAFESYAESVSTLKFANRAKNIKNEAIINEESDQGAIISKLEAENIRLKQLLTDRGITVHPGRSFDLSGADVDARDRAYDEEKRERQRLEGRVGDLERQLVTTLADADDKNSQREDVAQIDRYKQLLLKQRDIMLNLTQRLNERDETILRLQEELDAYDSHVVALEERLESGGGSGGTGSGGAPVPLDEAERLVADMKVFVRGDLRYRSAAAGDRLLTADEKIVELVMGGAAASNVNAPPATPRNLFNAAFDPASQRALEQLLMSQAEPVAKRHVQDNIQNLVETVATLRTSLAKAEQDLRVAEAAPTTLAGGKQQAERLRDLVESETAHLRDSYEEQLDALQQQLEAERRDSRALEAQLDRVSFDVRRLCDSRDAATKREADALYTKVQGIEQATGRELRATIGKLFTASDKPKRVDPNAALPSSNGGASGNQSSLRVMQLESAVATLKQQQETTRREMTAQVNDRNAKIADLEAEASAATSLRRQLHMHEKDRAALKKILEQRVKVKVDTIATALRSGSDARRVDAELSSLQNLVNASIAAMNSEQQ